ncbi:hypothetical protein BKA62DRAFT_783456 [Auriculariales sp. MPI-PUGE-AT-0066]|nr:hypothetical protein BKA62DRAFT_783456 [Auriculariales sp. MPI-PUGE-AT-0066]
MAVARDSACLSRQMSGKHAKRNPTLVHFADSERSRRTSQASTIVPHYQLHRNSRTLEHIVRERSESRSRSRSQSKGRTAALRPDAPPMSESEDESGYDAAYEVPSLPSSGPPTRPRTPDSSQGPHTPASQSFKESSTLGRSATIDARSSASSSAPSPAMTPLGMQMHLACVTSTDILNTLHINDVPREEIEPTVPFPYTVHWPERPRSPPLTPETKSKAPAKPIVVEQPAEPQPEAAKNQRRRTWSHSRQSDTKSTISIMSAARKSSTFLNLLAPHPTVHFPASAGEPVFEVDSPIDSPESTPASVPEASTSSIPIPTSAADMKSEERRSTLLALPRPTHARSRSEPVVVTGPSPSLTALAAAAGIIAAVTDAPILPASTTPTSPVKSIAGKSTTRKSTAGSRKLRKKRASAPAGSLLSSAAASVAPSSLSAATTLAGTKATTPASSNSTTPVSTVAFPIAERKKRVSALQLFGPSVPKGVQEEPTPKLTPAEEIRQMHRRNMSLPLLTPPSTPEKPSHGQPSIVITPPSATVERAEGEVNLASPVTKTVTIKGNEATAEVKKDVSTPSQKRSRFASIFGGGASSAPAPVPETAKAVLRPTKATDAKTERRRSKHRRSKSMGSVTSSTSSRLSTWHSKLRTTVLPDERDNAKLWPVPGGSAPVASRSTDILLLSAPMDPRPLTPGGGDSLHPSNEVAAWGRASTLSHTMTLLMGSGSAARSTRRLRKAGGVVRTRPRSFWDPLLQHDSDEAAGGGGSEDDDKIGEDYRWRMTSASTPSLLGRLYEEDAQRAWLGLGDSDCEDSDVPDLRRVRNSIDSTAREPVLSLLHELRRKRMLGRDANGLPSSGASTMSSVHSGTLLYRPLRPRRSASFSAASSMKLKLD